jgi:hypothetical protein
VSLLLRSLDQAIVMLGVSAAIRSPEVCASRASCRYFSATRDADPRTLTSGPLIRKSWSRDCDCGRCFVYLPIAYFARWCGCPSKACFDQFSLPLFTPDYSDSTMSIVLMCFVAIVMDPFLVGAVTNAIRPSPTSIRGLA